MGPTSKAQRRKVIDPDILTSNEQHMIANLKRFATSQGSEGFITGEEMIALWQAAGEGNPEVRAWEEYIGRKGECERTKGNECCVDNNAATLILMSCLCLVCESTE
jgi:hypothetical protein